MPTSLRSSSSSSRVGMCALDSLHVCSLTYLQTMLGISKILLLGILLAITATALPGDFRRRENNGGKICCREILSIR
ncbi:MAG: hypothetical protein U0903_07335 [Planctomycetales bacterium]